MKKKKIPITEINVGDGLEKSILNEYGYVAEGVIFDLFVRLAHIEAKANIGACMVTHAEIEYFAPATQNANLEEVKTVPVTFGNDTKCKVMIANGYAFGTFTFTKI